MSKFLMRLAALIMTLGIGVSAIAPEDVQAAPVHAAGLVVDYGDGSLSYAWVPFTEDEISGIDLLKKSELPILTIGFGGLGDGVCKIETTGCDVSACRQRLCQTADRSSRYWQYYRLGPTGSWVTQPLGASGSIVTDGTVDLWVWTAGDSKPTTAPVSFADIAARTGVGRTTPGGAPNSIQPVVETIGPASHSSANLPTSWTDYVLATAVVLAIVGIGGFVVWRSRHQGRGAL